LIDLTTYGIKIPPTVYVCKKALSLGEKSYHIILKTNLTGSMGTGSVTCNINTSTDTHKLNILLSSNPFSISCGVQQVQSNLRHR